MVIRICVCTHSFIQHQRLPYGEQPCHSITQPHSSHPSPRTLLLPQHLHTAPCCQHRGTLSLPAAPCHSPRAPLGLTLHPALPQVQQERGWS